MALVVAVAAEEVEEVEDGEVLVLEGHPSGYDPHIPLQTEFGASQAHVFFVEALPSHEGLRTSEKPSVQVKAHGFDALQAA